MAQFEAQIERRTIRSPIDGVLVEQLRQPGEFVSSNEATIATVAQLSQLRVICFLPTKEALRWSVGQQLHVAFPDTLQSTSATVDFVSPVTDSNSDTVRVELLIRNTESRFRSGVRCVIELPK